MPKGDNDLLIVIDNLYIETYYLKKMLAFNIAKEVSTIVRFREVTKKFKENSIYLETNRRIAMMKHQVNKLSDGLEKMYINAN